MTEPAAAHDDAPSAQPICVYGLKVSYFTGKLEAYLRYKEIPYAFRAMTAREFTKTIPAQTGAMQMPAVRLGDGRWMTDTSPMIDWFETSHTRAPILPGDPVQAFVCRLIEDYADEWLWRPAMHYRWSYPLSAKLLARQIADDMGRETRGPRWIMRMLIERRQRSNFVRLDGVSAENRAHVERSYLHLLEILEPALRTRPFLLGGRPTLADIGLMGPLLRHFSMDPTPAAIMRETAPAVMAWVYRVWSARASDCGGAALIEGLPRDLEPMLVEIGQTHLEALCANAEAFARGDKRYDQTIQGARYRNLQTSPYRVHCLEMLQERFAALAPGDQDRAGDLLARHGCLEPLMRIKEPASLYDPERQAPFGRSIAVFPTIRG